MKDNCDNFGCVYATSYGCIIKGHMDKEGPLNGKKQYCHIYDVQCIYAKCRCCIRSGSCERSEI